MEDAKTLSIAQGNELKRNLAFLQLELNGQQNFPNWLGKWGGSLEEKPQWVVNWNGAAQETLTRFGGPEYQLTLETFDGDVWKYEQYVRENLTMPNWQAKLLLDEMEALSFLARKLHELKLDPKGRTKPIQTIQTFLDAYEPQRLDRTKVKELMNIAQFSLQSRRYYPRGRGNFIY